MGVVRTPCMPAKRAHKARRAAIRVAQAHLKGHGVGGGLSERHGGDRLGRKAQVALGLGSRVDGTLVGVPHKVLALVVCGASRLASRLVNRAELLRQGGGGHVDDVIRQVAGQVAVGGELRHAVLRGEDGLATGEGVLREHG